MLRLPAWWSSGLRSPFACVGLIGYWGFDHPFRVGLESGWNCLNAFSYASMFQSQVGDTYVGFGLLQGFGQARPEALALVRLRFVQPNRNAQ